MSDDIPTSEVEADDFPRYEDVLGEVQQDLLDGIGEEEGRYGSTRQESFESLVIALHIVAVAKPQRVAGLAAVLAFALYDERAIHEKTYSNFEDFAEGAAETRVELEAERLRYRLAWTSARRRAKGRGENFRKMLALAAERLLALDESTRQRDEAYEALSMANRQRLKMLQQHTELIDALKVTRAERDEARAELAKAGEEIRQLRADRTWEAKRANEAARLSADARDDAEARDQVIAELREHIETVEGDRLTMLAWALNVLAEHGVEHEHGEEFAAIAQHIRDLKDAVATYRHVTDSSIQTREEAIAEAERLAADNTRLIEEVRTLREQPIRQGAARTWTEPVKLETGSRTITVKRACNGCGQLLGDVTEAEMEDAIAGRPPRDVRGECPTCTPGASDVS